MHTNVIHIRRSPPPAQRVRPSIAGASLELLRLNTRLHQERLSDSDLTALGEAGDRAITLLITTRSLTPADALTKLDSWCLLRGSDLWQPDDLVTSATVDLRRLVDEAPKRRPWDSPIAPAVVRVLGVGTLLLAWTLVWLAFRFAWRMVLGG